MAAYFRRRMLTTTRRLGPRVGLLVGLTVVVAGVVFLLPRLPQDASYHGFADQRAFLGVPSFANVVSNLAFVLAGALGLLSLRPRRAPRPIAFVDPRERAFFLLFFAAVALIGPGSAYYHWAPDNARLVWDRLPMTLAFMTLFAAIIGERLGVGAGRALLAPLFVAGVASVAYWHLTELRSMGDLRPYVLVQFYPMLAIPLLLLMFPPRYTRGGDLMIVLGLYGIAKLLELGDALVLSWLRVASGHALKHVVSAVACYWILRMLERRRPLASDADPPESRTAAETAVLRDPASAL
jgi:hypothetical protein